MDKYFLEMTKQVETVKFLTDEEINKIKQLPDITQIIEREYPKVCVNLQTDVR